MQPNISVHPRRMTNDRRVSCAPCLENLRKPALLYLTYRLNSKKKRLKTPNPSAKRAREIARVAFTCHTYHDRTVRLRSQAVFFQVAHTPIRLLTVPASPTMPSSRFAYPRAELGTARSQRSEISWRLVTLRSLQERTR